MALAMSKLTTHGKQLKPKCDVSNKIEALQVLE